MIEGRLGQVRRRRRQWLRGCAFALTWGLVFLSGGSATAETVRRAPGTLSGAGFSLPRAGVEQYGASALTCASGGALSLLEGELASQAKKAGRPAPKSDGPLCAAAEAFMGWNDPQSPSESVTRSVGWHFGVASPIRRIVIATIETEDPRIISERLLETAASFTLNATAPRLGLATYRVRREATRVVLLLSDTPLDLNPVPRQVAAGGSVVVEGHLAPELDAAKVLASNPVGHLTTLDSKGKEFRAQLACGPRPGRMQIEIRGERAGSTVTVANFPVACGSEVSNVVAVPPAPPKGSAVDAAQGARKMLDLMNRDRAAAGLAPVAWDDAVATVAKDAAEYLRDASSGRPARPFDLHAKLKAADVASPLILQNPVAAVSADEAHALLSTNPLDRSNLLNADATHVGVGAVATATADATPVIYFAELLVKELPAFDPAAVSTRLREAIAKRRADARAAPLTNDAVLDDVAAKYATALAGARGTLPAEQDREITAPLYKGFRTVNVISGVKSDPLEFAEESGIIGDAELVGVGVASGVSPSLGKNSAFVVVLTGTRHKAAGPQQARPKESGAAPAKGKRR